MKKRLSLLLKLTITIAGLLLVLRGMDLGDIGRTLAQAEIPWLLLSILLISASMALRAYRWLLLLHGLGTTVPFWRLVELYFIGSFFNAFLPSGFGGDVIRIVEINKDIDLDVATGTVFLDRLTGLTMLFVIGLLILPFRAQEIAPVLRWLIAGGAAASIIGIGLLLEYNLICRLGGWLPGPLSPTGTGLLSKVLKAVRACGARAVFAALGVSILFNLMLVTWWAAAGQGLGLSIPFSTYLFAVPVMSLALMAPSIGGLGVRELIAPAIFAASHIGDAQAVSLSFLVFILERLSGLVGAPLYLLANWRRDKIKSSSIPHSGSSSNP